MSSKAKKFKIKFKEDAFVNDKLEFKKGSSHDLVEASARRWVKRGHEDVSKAGQKLSDAEDKSKKDELAKAKKDKADKAQAEKDRLEKEEKDSLEADEKKQKEESEKREALCKEYEELTGATLTEEDAADLKRLEAHVEDLRIKAKNDSEKDSNEDSKDNNEK